MNTICWYEIWVDEGLAPPYVLLLLATDSEKKFEVYDPAERRVIFTASTYEAVKNWLLEDEYTRVEGRMTSD